MLGRRCRAVTENVTLRRLRRDFCIDLRRDAGHEAVSGLFRPSLRKPRAQNIRTASTRAAREAIQLHRYSPNTARLYRRPQTHSLLSPRFALRRTSPGRVASALRVSAVLCPPRGHTQACALTCMILRCFYAFIFLLHPLHDGTYKEQNKGNQAQFCRNMSNIVTRGINFSGYTAHFTSFSRTSSASPGCRTRNVMRCAYSGVASSASYSARRRRNVSHAQRTG